MRKIIILFSFILVSINFSTAQVCEKVDCDAIKNYVTIKIIEGSVKTDPNEKVLKDSFKKNTIESPLNYSEFANILSTNNFSQTREKLGDVINSIDIKTEYTKEEFASKIMGDIGAKLSDKQKQICDFDNLKGKLIIEINTYLDKKITESVDENETSNGQDSSDVVYEQTENDQDAVAEKLGFFSFSNLNLFSILSLLIPIMLFIILWIRVNTLFEKNERRKEEIKNMQNLSSSSQRVSNTSQVSRTEFENLLNNSKAFKDFHMALENLQKQSPINTHQPIELINQVSNQTTISSSNNSNIFYMKFPVENYFSDNYKSLTKENTIYRFFLKPNKNEAEYEIHTEGVKIDEIISMVERTIKTGCDEDNNPSNNTRSIKTINKGIASLEGDKWIIKRKALIRYE
jgi:hypothetical protein